MNSFTKYDFLCHHGVLGMKWGVRRYQNKDGSLTDEGRERYKNTQTKKQYLEKYGIIKGAAKDTIKKVQPLTVLLIAEKL